MFPYGPDPSEIAEKSLDATSAAEEEIAIVITELSDEEGGTEKLQINGSKPIWNETALYIRRALIRKWKSKRARYLNGLSR